MKRPKPHRKQLLIHRLVASQQRMKRSEIVGIGCALLEAVASVEGGSSVRSDAGTIAFSANLALLLSEQGLGEEYEDELVHCRDAAASLMAGEVLDAAGIVLLKRLAEIHIAQLESESCTWALIERAKDEMKRRTESGNVVRVEITQ